MDFKNRWDEEKLAAVFLSLKSNKIPESPFGLTPEGRVDLRGFFSNEPIILNSVNFDGIDLSFSRIFKLLCIRSEFRNSSFEKSKITLLNNGSVFCDVSFEESDLSTSGASGAAKFINANFTRAILTGAIFKEGDFSFCEFNSARIEKIDFGACKISNSMFHGQVKKSFFRGVLVACDFSAVNFIDCAFYGAEFENCKISKNAIILKNWRKSYLRICKSADVYNLSVAAKKSVEKWFYVWSELGDVLLDELIDCENLKQQEGVAVADEVFEFFKSNCYGLGQHSHP